jgi:hypothetical protein
MVITAQLARLPGCGEFVEDALELLVELNDGSGRGSCGKMTCLADLEALFQSRNELLIRENRYRESLQ